MDQCLTLANRLQVLAVLGPSFTGNSSLGDHLNKKHHSLIFNNMIATG